MVVDGPLRVWGLSKFVERLVRPLFHSGTKVCVLKQLEYVGFACLQGWATWSRDGAYRDR